MENNTNNVVCDTDYPVKDATGNLLSCGCLVTLSPFSAQCYQVASIDPVLSRCSLRRLGNKRASNFLFPSSSLYFVKK